MIINTVAWIIFVWNYFIVRNIQKKNFRDNKNPQNNYSSNKNKADEFLIIPSLYDIYQVIGLYQVLQWKILHGFYDNHRH